MPRASNNTLGSLCKILIYGDIKTKKTWWALRAAEAGFNVTLLDGDNGHHIIAKQSEKAKKKIAYIPLVDTPDEAFFHNFIGRMYKMKGFGVNERTRSTLSAMNEKQWLKNPEDPTMYFNPEKLNSNDVLIVDSWSAFCRSMAKHFAIQNDQNHIPTGANDRKNQNVDLGRQSWEDYGWGKNVAQKVLSMLQALPCHVVVIAHSVEHIVYEEKTSSSGKKVQEIKSQTMQPLGYSGPQGRILGQFFSDILYTYIDKMDKYRITTKPLFDAVGGSRILDPKIYSWDELSWDELIKASNGLYRLPDSGSDEYNSAAFEFLLPGELPLILKKESRLNKEAAEKTKLEPNSITEKPDGTRTQSSRLKRNTVINSKI